MHRLAVLVTLGLIAVAAALCCADSRLAIAQEVTFDINQFDITGNTIFPDAILRTTLAAYKGSGKTVEDVEDARTKLERYHQERGYPTVVVNIPQQEVSDGTVTLAVV